MTESTMQPHEWTKRLPDREGWWAHTSRGSSRPRFVEFRERNGVLATCVGYPLEYREVTDAGYWRDGWWGREPFPFAHDNEEMMRERLEDALRFPPPEWQRELRNADGTPYPKQFQLPDEVCAREAALPEGEQ